MSYALTVGQDGPAATAQVVWSVDGKTYRFRSDNNFISWITTIFEVGDVASGAGTIDYRLLRPTPATGNVVNANTVAGFGSGTGLLAQDNQCTGLGTDTLQNQLAGAPTQLGLTAVGAGAMKNMYFGLAGSESTAIGYAAMQNSGSAFSVAVGSQSMLGTPSTTLGSEITAVGYLSLPAVSGNFNVGIGSQTGVTLRGGAENTLLGTFADVDNAARSRCICLGYNTASPAINGSLAIGGSGANAMGNLIAATGGVAAGLDLVIYLNGYRYLVALKQ